MGEDGPSSWTGRREPNRGLAWVIIFSGTVLLLVAAYQFFFLELSVNIWFVMMIALAILVYASLSFTSSVEMTIELGEEDLRYTKRERSLGRSLRMRTLSVERSRMAKVVERNAGFGIRVVRIEGAGGRRLLTFPEFLGHEEHDEMITVIIEWGNQPSSPSSGSDDLPLPISR